MQYAAENLIPSTMELGGKSPNIFMADVMDQDDAFLDKALEGFRAVRLQQGRGLHLPVARSGAGIDLRQVHGEGGRARCEDQDGRSARSHHDDGRAGSRGQLEKILDYIDVGKQEGAQLATGGERAHLGGELENGYYVRPTVFVGHNKMRIFQEEIFGPVLSVTTFKTVEDAIAIGNDTIYGLGAGVWSRNGTVAYRVGPRDQGRPRVDQLLSHVPGARGVRRLQAFGLRPRDAQDDHGPLPADQEPAGQLQPERAWLLLSKVPRRLGC